ncbi:hypothetical protein PIB30_035070 [Stylosanthes scabra]|uniref:Uncharacterized protein n=1 Tax=Stylosanthes scabra TaxID=79078 RepID=A0ABU6ZBR1_9FABA|nr:hypothetical protein [Stylosanthes scabra]
MVASIPCIKWRRSCSISFHYIVRHGPRCVCSHATPPNVASVDCAHCRRWTPLQSPSFQPSIIPFHLSSVSMLVVCSHDQRLKRPVALMAAVSGFPSIWHHSDQAKKEFEVEVEAIRLVRHKNLVRSHRYFAEGTTLHALHALQWPPPRTVRIAVVGDVLNSICRLALTVMFSSLGANIAIVDLKQVASSDEAGGVLISSDGFRGRNFGRAFIGMGMASQFASCDMVITDGSDNELAKIIYIPLKRGFPSSDEAGGVDLSSDGFCEWNFLKPLYGCCQPLLPWPWQKSNFSASLVLCRWPCARASFLILFHSVQTVYSLSCIAAHHFQKLCSALLDLIQANVTIATEFSGEEPPESLFMKELKRRGMTPTSLLEDYKQGNSGVDGEVVVNEQDNSL